jgi:tetratricopeptide (TPR) repeat protein
MVVSPKQAWVATAVVVPVVLIGLLAGGVGGKLSDKWDGFKTPPEISGSPTQSNVFNRLQDSAGQGRYQYWQVALDGYKANKLTGTGGATFALWWAPRATVGGPVQDAHNLYMQTLVETGLIGALLLLGFVFLTVAGGVRRTMRNAGDARVLIAAATAAIIIFWVDASIEWLWQIAVLPVILLLLAAVVLGQRSPGGSLPQIAPRAILAVAAVLAFVPIVISSTTSTKIQQSQAAVRDGDLPAALADARTAAKVDSGAMTPKLQQALVLETGGALKAALPYAVAATKAEPTNWKPWIIRARIEARLGDTKAALASYRKARSLNPKSPVFRK